MLGFTEKDWALIESLLITPLKEKKCQIFVFGSRARGDQAKFSDLDILLRPTEDIDDLVGSIRDQLEESELPVKVDLVIERDLAESYRENVAKDLIEL